jgi:hypothetical protein
MIDLALVGHMANRTIKVAIKRGLDKELDVLLSFETRFKRYFEDALADAVASSVAEKRKTDVFEPTQEGLSALWCVDWGTVMEGDIRVNHDSALYRHEQLHRQDETGQHT